MNRAIKALLNHNRKSLKELNQAFRFDYNKPFQAIIIPKNTTVKQILKAIDHDDNTLIVALTCNPDHWNTEYRAAIINNDESIDIKNGYQHFRLYSGSGLGTYYTKGDFRESIKAFNSTTIVIAQEMKYLSQDKDASHYRPADMSQRFKVDKADNAVKIYSYKCDAYIDGIKLVETTNDGKKFEYHPQTHFNRTNDLNQIIDKSGYIVELSRLELNRKAKELKAERDKAAFKATDNTAKVDELKIRIKAKKLELIERLKIADTSEELEEIAKCLEHWNNGFTSIVKSFEDLQKRVNEKSYPSIEDFNRNYEGINRMLLNNGR